MANVADALTTYLALSQGAVEANPFMAVLVNQLGIIHGLGFKAVTGSALLYPLYRWRLAWVLSTSGAVFGSLAIWNTWVVWRL